MLTNVRWSGYDGRWNLKQFLRSIHLSNWVLFGIGRHGHGRL